MCGINFILDKTGKIAGDSIHKMNESIRHRGPDHQGSLELFHDGKKLYFGANRLRIIDQDSNSDQPMVMDGGKNVLVFSGEIYNYFDLKNPLIRSGIKFNTASDTEVLMHYLARFGLEGLQSLQGMFSFVYYDESRSQLIAARDRHGMKSLFYSENSNSIIISSESRGVLAAGINHSLSKDHVYEYLKYRYVNPPNTLYLHISQLSPGYCMIVDLKTCTKNIYCFVPAEIPEETGNENEIVPRVEEMLINSLIRHQSASKPVGIMLSGGIDSSVLMTISLKHQLPPMHSYSIVNDMKDRSFGTLDYRYSAWLSRKLKLNNHHEIKIGKDILDKIPDHVLELDQPIGDPAFILTSLLSREAVKEIGILLSGAGADEYFAGYNRHSAFRFYLSHHPYLKTIMKTCPVFSRILGSGRSHPLRKKFRLLRRFIENLDEDPATTYDHFMAQDEFKNLMQSNPCWPVFARDHFVEKYLYLALHRDRDEYLVGDILMMNDQLSLYHGVEMRSPYLDDQLTNYMQRISPVLLLKHGRKWILKEILKASGLGKIARRQKEGFGFPFGQWIREKKFRHLSDNLLDNENPLFNFIDYNRTRNMIGKHLNYKEDHSTAVFSLIVLSEWLKRN